jgi:hypothetical protein
VGRYISQRSNPSPGAGRAERELETLPAAPKERNPMRRCDVDDIRAIYRLLLHREPESQMPIGKHVDNTTVYYPVRGFLSSREFAESSTRVDHPW